MNEAKTYQDWQEWVKSRLCPDEQACNDEPTQLDRIESKLDELLARKKRVVKAKGSTDDYPEWFEKIWAEYPKRSGSNPKRKAFDACNSRVKEAFKINGYVDCADYLWSRTVDYCKYCDAVYQDKRYVMQAATFYGYSKPYEGDFAIPATKLTVPSNDDAMLKFALERGMREPKVGETWQEYRRYVESKVQS